MLPYGWDGTNFIPLLVDEEGRGITVIKGQADVTWDLHGWWKFVASEKANIKDYSGNANNGIAYSGAAEKATYEDGVVGQSIKFDGTDDYVLGSGCGFNDFPFTIEFWVEFSEFPPHSVIVTKNHTGSQYKYANYLVGIRDTPSVILGWGDGTEFKRFEVRPSLSLERWYHFVCIFASTTVMKLYINTVLQSGVYDGDATVLLEQGTLRFGYNLATWFKGNLDEVRIYGRELSTDEIEWRYNQTNPALARPTRMVAVDNEGRMMVNIQDLPYKDTILAFKYVVSAPGAWVDLTCDPVPAGKLWVVTNVIGRAMLEPVGTTSLYIRRSGVDYMIDEIMRTDVYMTLNFHGHAYLKAGDVIKCTFSGTNGDADCQLYVNGYSLNV